MTHEEAVREWVARQVRFGDGLSSPRRAATRDEIRDVEFGIERGWGGSDVTPAEEDYACVHYELLKPNGDWVEQKLALHMTPATIVAECLEIYERELTTSPTTRDVDAAIERVQNARWGASLTPPSPTVTTPVFNRFLRDARTLASELRRVRTLAGVLAATRQPPPPPSSAERSPERVGTPSAPPADE